MLSTSHPGKIITLKYDLLVYAFCHVYKCKSFIFSSKAKPKVVIPQNKYDNAAIPFFVTNIAIHISEKQHGMR